MAWDQDLSCFYSKRRLSISRGREFWATSMVNLQSGIQAFGDCILSLRGDNACRINQNTVCRINCGDFN